MEETKAMAGSSTLDRFNPETKTFLKYDRGRYNEVVRYGNSTTIRYVLEKPGVYKEAGGNWFSEYTVSILDANFNIKDSFPALIESNGTGRVYIFT